MKAEDLYESIGTVDEDLLERSEQRGKETDVKGESSKGRRLTPLIRALIAAAAVLVICGIIAFATGIFRKNTGDPMNPVNDPVLKKYVLAGVSLPDVSMPDEKMPHDADELKAWNEAWNAWFAAEEARTGMLAEYGIDKAFATVERFTFRSMKEFLSGQSGQNKVYSPINIYLMLGMLAESTAGNSREQLLSLAGVDSIEDMRALSKALWNHLYKDTDEEGKCILGASLWLDDSSYDSYNQDTLNRLASDYYASSFSGKMGSKAYTEAFQRWMNNMTGGMLEDSVKELELRADTIIALATTICFAEQWENPFSKEKTKDLTFHAADGDKTVAFMHEDRVGSCYRGEKFVAVKKENVWLILPNKGVSMDELMDDPELANMMSKTYDELERVMIHLDVPKFNIKDDPDLIEALTSLGVTDIFGTKADFSPLLSGGAYVNEAKHSVCVQVDEDGVKAAAFTEVNLTRGMQNPCEEELDITFDRPFLFFVEGGNVGLPLFVGVVENP